MKATINGKNSLSKEVTMIITCKGVIQNGQGFHLVEVSLDDINCAFKNDVSEYYTEFGLRINSSMRIYIEE